MTTNLPPILPSLRPGSSLEVDVRTALEELARTAPDSTREQIEAVLRGDLSLRQFAVTDGFSKLVAPGIAAAQEQIQQMSPDELRRAAETADDEIGSSFR